MSDFNEDEVVHIELVGKRRVYSEAAYNKLLAERDRLRGALKEIRSLNSVNALILDIIETAIMQEDRDE